jgi:GntR family transcriptional regulator
MNYASNEALEHVIDDTRPIFLQIAERIEEDILAGQLAEEEQAPSTNQFAALYQINPATAAKGVNLLVD